MNLRETLFGGSSVAEKESPLAENSGFFTLLLRVRTPILPHIYIPTSVNPTVLMILIH